MSRRASQLDLPLCWAPAKTCFQDFGVVILRERRGEIWK